MECREKAVAVKDWKRGVAHLEDNHAGPLRLISKKEDDFRVVSLTNLNSYCEGRKLHSDE